MRAQWGIAWGMVASLLGAAVVVWLLADQERADHDAPLPQGGAPDPAVAPPSPPSLTVADPAAVPGVVQGRLVARPGLPVAAARLFVGTLEDRGAGWLRPKDVTEVPVSAAGRFTERPAGSGPLWVLARLSHEGRSYRTCFLGPRALLPRFLVLRPPDPVRGVRRLRVTVRDPDGDGPGQGRVGLWGWDSKRTRRAHWEELAGSGPLGFDVDPTRHTMWIRAVPRGAVDGRHGMPLLVGPLPASGGHLHLTLAAATNITGLLVDAQGAGIANEALAVRPADPDYPTELGGAHWPWVRSNAEGRFVLGPVQRGRHSIVLPDLEGAGPFAAHTDREDTVLRVSSGDPVEITVVDAAGEPLPGAGVRAQHGVWTPVSGERARVRTGIADARGVARIHGLDGEKSYRLSVWPPRGRGELRILNREGWRPRSETVTLVTKEIVRVEVHDEEGRPLPHASAWYRSSDWDPREGGFDRLPGAGTIGWRKDLGEGEALDLYATHGSLPAPEAKPDLRVTRPGDYTITLARGPTLLLRLVGLRGSTEGLSVRVEEEGDRRADDGERYRASSRLDAEGRCEIFGLSADRRFAVLIGDAGKGGWGRKTGLRPGGEEVVIEAVAGGPMQGTVLKARGVVDPAAFVTVVCLGAGFQARADEQGRFSLPEIPPGRWPLSATVLRGGYVVRRGTVEVQPNQDVTIMLQDVGD